MMDPGVRGPTSRLLHHQLVADLLLVLVEVIQCLSVKTGLPQNLVLIEQQLTVLIVHLVWRGLGEERETAGVKVNSWQTTKQDGPNSGLISSVLLYTVHFSHVLKPED